MTGEAPRSDDAAGEQHTLLADGRRVSTEELAPLVYEDLRKLAESFFRRERPGVTLQPTALVHEAWMHLADQRNQSWDGRSHFLAVAATAMRRVLINAAKARGRLKRGGDWERVTLSDVDASTAEQVDLIALDEALGGLAEVNPRYARVVELRCFAGLNLEQTAQVLGIGRTTAVKEWALAKAWLATKLEDAD